MKEGRTLRDVLFQNGFQVRSSRLSNRLELLAIYDLQTRAHIASIVSKVDLQALIAKYCLLITKDRIGHLRVEGVKCSRAANAGSDEGHMDGIV